MRAALLGGWILGGHLVLMGVQSASIEVFLDQPTPEVSRYLTGVCIEDVNHEIYGGLYSQLLFGESFQEPPPVVVPFGFEAFGGHWRVDDGVLDGAAGPGPKLIAKAEAFLNGKAGVELFFPDQTAGNAGLILRVADPGVGADRFNGYEISLSPSDQTVRLGRHRQDWQLLHDVAWEVPTGEWISLEVELEEGRISITVDGQLVVVHEEDGTALSEGRVGLRTWMRAARFRRPWVDTGAGKTVLSLSADEDPAHAVSGMWGWVSRATATGTAAMVDDDPFVGRQSQRIIFQEGLGAVGVENRGLNRWGLSVEQGRPYSGVVWLRAALPVPVRMVLESVDGDHEYAAHALVTGQGASDRLEDWIRYEFTLRPNATDGAARFAILLEGPGAVDVGYAFLEPGAWGRYRGLPVRRDVAEAMVNQGLTVLRYGGSMINHPEYRWKSMIGPRDRRRPSTGTWYPYSSNGWGIIDFIAFCRAAGFLAIPAFNMDETPEDMVDFIEYVNGAADSEWGARRVADGFPEPFGLRYIQLGNEERVDAGYVAKFKPLAEAIWEKSPEMTIVVGDFAYHDPILNPWALIGAASGIRSLEGHQEILRLAKLHGREVWFDVHIGTEGPYPDSSLDGAISLVDRLEEIADGAAHRVVVFELNANNHSQRRALANALAIHAIERDGRIPVVLSANGLQPDGQNDNGWDQGLLFLNPSQVWLQPPGWVMCMMAGAYLPFSAPVRVESMPGGTGSGLDVCARRDESGREVVVQLVNPQAVPVAISVSVLPALPSGVKRVKLFELSAPLNARNRAESPYQVVPRARDLPIPAQGEALSWTVPPHSFSVLHCR
ncbi:MAG: DUF1080 domain-containing protein [Verrucomicrobiota bacterium]|jgi:hypothetical protein|nr:DUF1080 domain-containing protein [Verrucomicrobiota bacterium]MDD8051904.1 DUF1080 domain-containing protein [Verrucomicrobiota bacterium]